MIMIKLDDLRPIFIGLAMSFKILGSTASRPIFLQLIARPINMGSIYPILLQTWHMGTAGQKAHSRKPMMLNMHINELICIFVLIG